MEFLLSHAPLLAGLLAVAAVLWVLGSSLGLFATLVLLLLLALIFMLLWPVAVMPRWLGAFVLAARSWLGGYWKSQGG